MCYYFFFLLAYSGSSGCSCFCRDLNTVSLCPNNPNTPLQAATLIKAQSKSLQRGWREGGWGAARGCQKTRCYACILRHLSVSLSLSSRVPLKSPQCPACTSPFLFATFHSVKWRPLFLMTLTLCLYFFEKFNPAPLIQCQPVSNCDN